jgi:hypothetical protein
MRRRALLYVLLFAAACDSRRIVGARPDGLSFDLAFPVITELSGVPLRIAPPFRVDELAAPVLLDIDLERETLFLVGLNLDTLREIAPELIEPEAIALSLADPPQTPVRRETSTGILSDRSVPAEMAILRLEDRDPASFVEDEMRAPSLRKKLTLTFPIDPEHCGEDRPPLLRRADLESESEGLELTRVLRLDGDRVLALARSPATLYLYTRGAPSVTREFSTAGVDFVLAGGLAVHTSSTGVRTVIVAAEKKLGDDRADGVIYELDLEGSNFSPTRTATTVPGKPLYDLLYDRTGNTIAVGELGVVLVRATGETDFLEQPRPPVVDAQPELLAITAGSPERPHFVAGVFRTFSGNALSAAWSLEQVAPLEGEKVSVVQLAEAAGGERYAVTVPSGFYRASPNEPLARVRWPRLPRFRECTNLEIDEPVELRDVVAHGDDAYVASACGALLRVRGPNVCVSVVELEGRTIDLDGPSVSALDVSHGFLTAGDTQGRLWEAMLPE